jgi:hypothetical protein
LLASALALTAALALAAATAAGPVTFRAVFASPPVADISVGSIDVAGASHAALFLDRGASSIDLHPAGYVDSIATAFSQGRQVGYGTPTGGGGHALLWSGSAASVVDLNGDATGSSALDIDGNIEVGDANAHAALWPALSPGGRIDLNPSGSDFSSASAVARDLQVGWAAFVNDTRKHAMLWRGSAASAVDLNPAGFDESYANDVNDAGWVVGFGVLDEETRDERSHALLWGDATSGASPLDLNDIARASDSTAYRVDNRGVIYGQANGRDVMWVPVSATAIPLPPAAMPGLALLVALGTSKLLLSNHRK